MTAHSGLQYNIKAEINNVGLLFKFVRQTKYVTVLSESTVIDEKFTLPERILLTY